MIKRLSYLSRIGLLFTCWLFCNISQAVTRTTDLRCEMLNNPKGIDNICPGLSWKLKIDHNGACQTSYQIIAASAPNLLNEKDADLWNTGKVKSDQSLWVHYAGKALSSRSLVYWKVRIWDETNNASPWSEEASFGIGLLNITDWKAKYIGAQRKDSTASPLLHKTFQCNDPSKKSFLHINTLGFHEVYLNGKRISDDVLVPAVSEFPKRSLSMTYDVTSYLQKGRNDIIIWLGKGWYDAPWTGVIPGGPFVMAEIDRQNGNHWETLVATDNTWQTHNSGYYFPGSWARNDFDGEIVNASQLLTNFNVETLDKINWAPVYEAKIPIHLITPMMCEPNIIQAELHPACINRFDTQTWMIDMGKSVVGWTKVHFRNLKQGQKIYITYGDMLGLNGDFEGRTFTDQYIASGQEDETFMNKFNYHAYRYIKIKDLTQQPNFDDITSYSIYTGYDTKSAFVCSDKDMNAIHDMVHYTFPCLTTSGYMVDCPHLERKGYGGDGNASILSAQMMYDLYPLYNNWIQAYADAQQKDGEVSHIGPDPSPCGGGPFWCAFIANAPWQTYVQYGNKDILERYYPNMQQYLKYAEQFMPDGLLTLAHRWPNTRQKIWFLGDWALPNEEHQLDQPSIDDVNCCAMSWVYEIMTKIASVLGKKEDQKIYEKKHDAINKRIHQTFFHPEDNTYGAKMQLDLAFPMFVSATPTTKIPEVEQALKDITAKKFDGHFYTGLVGIPILTQWLTKKGEAQFVYDILKKHSYPGYLYMIDNNATTTWEHWEATRSRIHNCYNGIGSWFYEALGGITPDETNPAYRHFYIKPQPVEGITYVRVNKPTPYGDITVDWNKTSQTFDMKINIPAGTSATIQVPFKAVSAEIPPTKLIRYGLIYSEKQADKSTEVKSLKINPAKPLELKSGKYRIIYHLK